MSGARRRRMNASLARLARELPIADLAPLASGIFALFALFGPIIDILSGGHIAPAVVVMTSLVSGFVAVGYALGAMRRNWWLFLSAVALHVLWFTVLPGNRVGVPGQGASVQLKADAIAGIVFMLIAYSAFLGFINGTAAQYLRVRTEIDLARDIHRVLVPAVAMRIGEYEFAGFSAASGAVGGDLVDVVPLQPLEHDWFGYVADVSGHGVSSGVVMGMFKSALRMRLRQGGAVSALLDDLNAVMCPLKSSAMYVTAACVRGCDGGALEYAVAGHLPILRVRDGRVDELTTPQIPIGMFEDRRFTSASIDCASGDLLTLLTDGLIEVFDAADRELGLDAVKVLLASGAGRPLNEIADAIVAKARAHGAQLDDQTLLLIRRA
jgi:serine phosphatase RsbU (regulator of sigma subunit)